MNTKQVIGALMDVSDAVARIRKEMDGMVSSLRPLTAEEHEAIKDLLLGIQMDAGLADSARFDHYERINERMFSVVK